MAMKRRVKKRDIQSRVEGLIEGVRKGTPDSREELVSLVKERSETAIIRLLEVFSNEGNHVFGEILSEGDFDFAGTGGVAVDMVLGQAKAGKDVSGFRSDLETLLNLDPEKETIAQALSYIYVLEGEYRLLELLLERDSDVRTGVLLAIAEMVGNGVDKCKPILDHVAKFIEDQDNECAAISAAIIGSSAGKWPETAKIIGRLLDGEKSQKEGTRAAWIAIIQGTDMSDHIPKLIEISLTVNDGYAGFFATLAVGAANQDQVNAACTQEQWDAIRKKVEVCMKSLPTIESAIDHLNNLKRTLN